MRLMDIVKGHCDNIEYIDRVKECLENRISWLEDREPESDGMVYDEWQDKYDDLSDIIDMFESGDGNIKERWQNIKNEILSYQLIYGGLSRLLV